ncbi:thiamine pyrophosphate-requiring protein [Curtobacterium sp. MCBD17_034]|uniref:thiamine pyrophosphate-requiring protein n=1 Tax=unclassified Curtobacterium TaxID=257496 RepID=UPI000DA70133|nr:MULTISPECIES: thiamine pyrophosphate-requiring protein [unclassified Curtobacterium]PZE78442.1 thiamine pyrophosphate-requiring protein [Curtobacterium sp. MCBD17_019]PZF57171.1 thiamine pyrophosphate-requiring protein [Curtobacterium sp. MCBD17_034]PZM33479.1 thiamine pyrophosphate-requiring protein [Curtobacterium sp. MCBD17_031]
MTTVSEFLIERIKDQGVSRIFGFPGDGIGAFDGALGKTDRAGTGIEYIRPTHEEICALMATAHAKFTGEVGVCVATSSPGAFHMLNGLYDAQMDNQPVVAIVGQQGLDSIGTFTQQESNLERVFTDVACYVETIVSPDQASAVIDTAFRTARLRLQPAVVVIPHDVQAMTIKATPSAHWVSRSSEAIPSTAITPPMEQIRQAADIINAGEKVTFLVGAGATGATDEVLAAAEKAGAGIITALRGKDVIPSDVPYHTQQVGLLGSLPSLHQIKRCDTIVLLGTNYPYGEFLPATGQARGIQVDLKPEQLGVRYPTELNLWGDVKSTLEALLPLLEQKTDLSWQERIAAEMQDWEQEMHAQAQKEYHDGVNPRRVTEAVNANLPDGAIVTADAGTTADWFGHHIRLKRGMRGDLSGRLATMLAAMPYAVAAKLAHSDKTVVCTIGDGAFQMLGMNELITVKKYMQQWETKQFIIVVMHNDDLAQVSWEMRTEDGNPLWRGSQDVESMDYAGYAELLGFRGVQVRSDDQVESAVAEAFAHDGVTLIDAYVSRNVPPLPPHITREYALNTAKSLLKGDPMEAGVIRDSASALATEGIERVKDALHIGDRK